MSETIKIILKYSGEKMESGSIPVGTVVDALTGFSAAYWKIASQLDPNTQHALKLSSIRSANGQIQPTMSIPDSSKWIIEEICSVISAKKHTRGKTFNSENNRGDTIALANEEGSNLAISARAFEIFESKMIDYHLNKLTAPLNSHDIDSAEIIVERDTQKTVTAEITNEDTKYFQTNIQSDPLKESEVAGTLISLNKETNRGTFKLDDGRKIPYCFKGECPKEFYQDFLCDDPIKVVCEPCYDENSMITSIDIKSTHRFQSELIAS